MQLLDGEVLGLDLAGDGGFEVGARRQWPQAEHLKKVPVQFGPFLFPVGARLDVGKRRVGDLLHLLAKVSVTQLVAALCIRRGICGRQNHGGTEKEKDAENSATAYHGRHPPKGTRGQGDKGTKTAAHSSSRV